jgi:Transglycosylase SLT domain
MRLRPQEDPDGVAGSLSPVAMGIRRTATWGLVVLAALLILDGSTGGLWRGSGASTPVDSVEAARSAVTAALGTHLRSRNASLSSEEQQRVVDAVLRSSRRFGLDPYLVTAVLIVESDARPWAESGKGAIGLMQVMPHMAAKLDLAGNLATIESNIGAGCYILAENIHRLGEERGISAYFWGRQIRGVAYLEKVQRARARVRDASPS